MATSDILEGLITRIRVQSAFMPDVVIDDPFKPGPPSPLLGALKPKITVELLSGKPIVVAPWGEPGPTRWPEIKKGLVAVGVLAAVLIVRRMVR